MQKTSIAWTNRSANPIRARNKATGKVGWHCVLKSTGCANCYSQAWNRFRGTGLPFQARSADEIELFLDPKPMDAILRLREKGQRIFVCDMTDLFGEFIPDEWIDQVFACMALARDQTFQVLTKRPQRMLEYFSTGCPGVGGQHDIHDRYRAIRSALWPIITRYRGREPRMADFDGTGRWPIPNVHLGVSVEDQARADERIPHLLRIPAAVRFLSVEPLLEAVDLRLFDSMVVDHREPGFGGPGYGRADGKRPNAIDWVIVGGESGPKARPCDIDWIRSIIGQCRDAGVHCFCKQLSAKPYEVLPESHPWEVCNRAVDRPLKLRDKKGSDPSEWPADLRVREFPRLAGEGSIE